MKCSFKSRTPGELRFYLTELSLTPLIKSMLLFLPIIGLITFDWIPLTLKLILGLSYLMKVTYYFLLTVDIHGFMAVHQALENRQTMIEKNLSGLKIFKRQEKSLKRIQDIYLLGIVIIGFWSWKFLIHASLWATIGLVLILFYEILLFYFKSIQLKQVTAQCFVRVQALTH